MLSHGGFISEGREDSLGLKKAPVRAWHVQKVLAKDSDDSDDDL